MEKNYPTSQIVTSIVLKLMWESCRENRESFADFKAKYTDAFIDARIAEIDAADELPSEEARALGHVRLHNEIIELSKEGRKNWQSLKLYIADFASNPEDEWNAAGWANYEKASNDNWPSLKDLLLKGSQYIAANTAALSANDNMPAGFPAAYNLKMGEINTKLQNFYDEIQDSRVATAVKVEAYNLCYNAGISMGADGQHIFMNNAELQKQFSYEAVTNVVTPPGAASLAVDVTFNGLAKQGAEVSIVGTGKSGITNIQGVTLLTQLPEGPAVCKIVCDGCADQLINITLSAGTTSRIHATLQPLFTGEMTIGSESPQGSQQPA